MGSDSLTRESICAGCQRSFRHRARPARFCSRSCRGPRGSYKKAVSPETRFWKWVNKTDSCWLWTGNKVDHGYGALWVSPRQVRAHRFSYELAHGKIPEGLDVLHHCDNPPCVNPAHLFVGTARDNSIDMMAKRRSRVPKLSPEAVQEIRAAVVAGETRTAVSKRYSVSISAVGRACAGHTWAWVSR